MDFDLNQEPLDLPHGSMLGLECLLNELETTQGHIEERIRQLEAVISRARHRQRWRQSLNIPQTVNNSMQVMASEVQSDDTLFSGGIVFPVQERISEARKIVKKNNTSLISRALGLETDATSLIARALGLETDATNPRRDHRDFFDCNICLCMAKEPILTCCGHLFCWPCFYTWPYGHSSMTECPVCMEEVADTSIIPIYGNGNDTKSHNFWLNEFGMKVPPRPRAQRVEHLRPQLGNRRAISSLIDRNTQQFNMISTAGGRSEPQISGGAPISTQRFLADQSLTNQIMPAMQRDGNQNHRTDQLSMVLERSSSFSNISSALNSAMDSAERLFRDLEASIQSHHRRLNNQQSSSDVDRDSFSSIAATIEQSGEILHNAVDTDSTAVQSLSSSRSSDASIEQLENQSMNIAVESHNVTPISSSSSRRTELSRISEVISSIEVNSTAPRSSSSRRRSEVPRASNVDGDPYRNHRRRRLM